MSLLTALCRANQGILRQQRVLIQILTAKHGLDKMCDLYQTPCPIVKATMGQHIRHSMDHIERAVTALPEIHYDLRQRDTVDEHDWFLADARIIRVGALLEELSKSNAHIAPNQPVGACFMLSGDSSAEFCLPSTIARELGFAAHHAIHHMAMVKIIATNPEVGGLTDADLPADFGRAPSTVNYDHTVKKGDGILIDV